MLTEQKVLDALKEVQDPELNKSLVELNMIRDIQIFFKLYFIFV